MSTSIRTFAARAGEGMQLRTPTTGSVVGRAKTSKTNALMTVLELWIPPNDGPGRHSHLREDELWYAVEGDFRFQVGDVLLSASTGGMAFGPRGLPHAFQNVGDGMGRLLVVTTPSGLERFFEQADELSRPVSPELGVVGRPNWLDSAGPPLAVSDPLWPRDRRLNDTVQNPGFRL